MHNVAAIIVQGTALAVVWFWLFTLISRVCDIRLLRIWFKVIVPQGIIVALALYSRGWL